MIMSIIIRSDQSAANDQSQEIAVLPFIPRRCIQNIEAAGESADYIAGMLTLRNLCHA